jgi:hypothetical protein
MNAPIPPKKTTALSSRRFVMAWAACLVAGPLVVAAAPPGVEYRRPAIPQRVG